MLPLAVYNLKFAEKQKAEKQKSGVAAFQDKRANCLVAITGLAAHTPSHPYTRQGEGEENLPGKPNISHRQPMSNNALYIPAQCPTLVGH